MARNKIIYNGEVLIDLTGDTVSASKLLSGYTAHDKSGAIINGACTFDANTSDATALPDEVLATKTYYKGGAKVTGQMPNNGGTNVVVSSKSGATIPRGFSDGSAKAVLATADANALVAGNIKQGVTILGVEGSYSGGTVTAESKTVTPSASEQTVLPTSTDYLSSVTVKAIPYVESANAYGTTVTIG